VAGADRGVHSRLARVASVPRQRLVHGTPVPAFFYGTAWKEARTAALVAQALRAGFRAIDTANQRQHYFEAAVGRAIAPRFAKGTLTRAELFLQSKFTHRDGHDQRLPYDERAPVAVQVSQSFQSSLEHLGVSYLDSYLLHAPLTRQGLGHADWAAWRAIEGLQRQGSARLIGVSNVTLEQLAELVDDAEIKPAFVQNRCFARTGWDRELRAFAAAHGIAYQAFSLLTANTRELVDPVITSIARRIRRTPEQVVFRFALEVGMIPLTGTADSGHMRQDLECLDFELAPDELTRIEKIAVR
jgi:diketogulonate reductase-like aldo/keto reductase